MSEPATPHTATRTLADLVGLDRLIGDPVARNLFAVGIAVVVALAIYAGLRRLLVAAARRNRGLAEFEPTLARVLRWFYAPLALLFVLQQAGVNLGSLWTVLSAGLAMVAIGFVATWSVLSNLSAAFMILSTRMFKIGDVVELMEPTATTGLRGRVVDHNLVYTTIEHGDASGAATISKIPNNVFLQKTLRVHPRDAADGAAAPATAGDSDG